jgi:hypothetical protein
MTFDLITCPNWGARNPRGEIVRTGPAARVIFHHTAGHHPEIAAPRNESREEAIAYARAIQYVHMRPSRTDPSKPWIDSGHNFLVCRNGIVLQGRWQTVSAIKARQMVVSAHCPGQNDQIGVEHEHAGDEPMTAAQREASAQLMAWIAEQYGRRFPLPIYPHSRYFPTACPGRLAGEMAKIAMRAGAILRGEDV